MDCADEAADALERGDYATAIAQYEQQIATNPADLSAYWSLGIAQFLQGEVELAQEIWMAAIAQVAPDELTDHLTDLCQRLYHTAEQQQSHHPTLAIALYEQLLELDADQPDALIALGNLWAERGHLETAIAHWQQGLTLAPERVDAATALAQVWERLGNWEAAIATYAHCLQIQPHDLTNQLALAGALIQQGQWSAAIAQLQQTLAQSPNHAPAWGELGYALSQSGRPEEATTAFRRAIQLQPDPFRSYQQWVALCIEQNTYPELIQQNAQFIESLQSPADPATPFLQLGRLLQQQGQFQSAQASYEAALSQPSPPSEALLRLSQVLQAQGQFAAAIALLQPGISSADSNPALQLEFGKALAKTQDLSGAIATLQRALTHQPDLADAWYHLGQQYSALHQWGEAIAAYQNYLHHHPGAIAALCQLGFAQIQQQQVAEGLANFGQALRLNSGIAGTVWKQLQGLLAEGRLDATDPRLQAVLPIDPPRLVQRIGEEPGKGAIAPSAIDYLPLSDGELVSLQPPGTLDDSVHFSFRFEAQMPLPPSFVIQLPGGRFWIDPDQSSSAVITADDVLLRELSPEFPLLSPDHPDQMTRPHWLQVAEKIQPPEIIAGTVLVLAGLANGMYFHWMCDVLPRLELLEQAGILLDEVDYILVNGTTPFQRETLAQFGIPPHKILDTLQHQHLQANQLIVPSFSGSPAWMSPQACAFLRRHFLPQSGQSTPPHRKLYISRQQTATRRVINEIEVSQFLAGYGFETVTLESLSVLEQAQLLSEAAIAISPHGSGLTNVLFCQPGATVIELFSPSYVYPCYWYLADLLNLNYYYLLGSPLGSSHFHRLLYPNPRTEDIYLEIQQLETLLRMLG